jgi:hypothetical protein
MSQVIEYAGRITDSLKKHTNIFPIYFEIEFDSGKWGKWSEWSPCTSKFSWGSQIRYRFCDSPPPRYGGKFCEVICF